MTRRTIVNAAVTGAATLAVAALVVPPAVAFGRAMAASRAQAARANAALARHRRAILADQETLAGWPLLAVRAGARDAGPVIAPRVAWNFAEPGAVARWQGSLPEGDRGRALDTRAVEALPPLELLGPEQWRDIDLSWMEGLASFDHWDLDGSAPESAGPFRAQPHLPSLLAWARLRLARGLSDGRAGAAIAEVEELVRLCASAEEPSLLAAAAELSGLLLRARALARERGQAAPAGPDPSLVSAFRRAAQAPRAWVALRAAPDHDPDWVRLRIGRCAALQDGLAAALAVRPWVGWGRRDEYRRLQRLLDAAPECRLHALRARWVRPDAPALPFTEDWLDWAARMGAARLRAEAALGALELDWLSPYEGAASR